METAEKKLVGKRGVKDWAAGERKKEVKRKKGGKILISSIACIGTT